MDARRFFRLITALDIIPSDAFMETETESETGERIMDVDQRLVITDCVRRCHLAAPYDSSPVFRNCTNISSRVCPRDPGLRYARCHPVRSVAKSSSGVLGYMSLRNLTECAILDVPSNEADDIPLDLPHYKCNRVSSPKWIRT